MSLRTVTDKIDGILQAIALLAALGMWAVLGFPFIPELAGYISLCIVGICTVAVGIWWIASRSAHEK